MIIFVLSLHLRIQRNKINYFGQLPPNLDNGKISHSGYIYIYHIASNKRRGRSFNFFFFFFWGGGAFIQGRRLHEGGVYYKIQKNLQFYISTKRFCHLLLSEKRDYLLHQCLAYCRYSYFDIRYEDIICKPHNTLIPVYTCADSKRRVV